MNQTDPAAGDASSVAGPADPVRGCFLTGCLTLVGLVVLSTLLTGICSVVGGGSSSEVAPPTTPYKFDYAVSMRHCGSPHPEKPTATAFFVLGSITNKSTQRVTFDIWVRITDGSGATVGLDTAIVRSSQQGGPWVEPGETREWEGGAPLDAVGAAKCEVVCVAEGLSRAATGNGIKSRCQAFNDERRARR